jgi:hypothetical protein
MTQTYGRIFRNRITLICFKHLPVCAGIDFGLIQLGGIDSGTNRIIRYMELRRHGRTLPLNDEFIGPSAAVAWSEPWIILAD